MRHCNGNSLSALGWSRFVSHRVSRGRLRFLAMPGRPPPCRALTAGRQVAPRDAQASALAIAEDDVSAMLPYDRAGDGEAESDASRLRVAGAANSVEGFEYLLSFAPRNSGSFVVDRNNDALAVGDQTYGALFPYLTALSTRLETARRMAVGRQEIVTPRGPENVTGSPASDASWQIPSTSALRSTSDRGSCFVSSRAKERTDSIISAIMSSSASIFCCCS